MKNTTKKLLGAALAAIMLMLLCTGAFASSDITGANWMSAVSDDTKITALNIPGTHDSATQNASFSAISQTQDLSIAAQLNAGVRYFDIRLKKSGNNYISVHSLSNKQSLGLFAKDLTADDIIASCRTFLKANPGETILFLLKEESSNTKEAFYSGFFDKYVAAEPELWFVQNCVPTMGQVRGKIVLLRTSKLDESRFDDSNSAVNFEEYPHIPGKAVIDFKTEIITNVENTQYISTLYVQDSYKLSADKKWTAVTTFLESEKSKENFNICVTSSTDRLSPRYNANIINKKLMEYDFKDGETYGVISCDFINAQLCEKIYSSNSPVMTNAPLDSNEINGERIFSFLGQLLKAIEDMIAKLVAGTLGA